VLDPLRQAMGEDELGEDVLEDVLGVHRLCDAGADEAPESLAFAQERLGNGGIAAGLFPPVRDGRAHHGLLHGSGGRVLHL